MRNQMRFTIAALTLAAIVFSTGCPKAPETTTTNKETATATPSPRGVPGLSACSVQGVNDYINARIGDKGPLAAQFHAGKFVFKAEELVVKTPDPKGGTQDGHYVQLIISKNLTDYDKESTPQKAPTLHQLNGIIQPLVNWGPGSNGPCVVAVKYVTEGTSGVQATDDFMWSFCPVGTQVCSDGTCSEYCSGGTRAVMSW